MKPPPEREIQIGRRLRAFREAKRISRTAFALSIRIGSERLASYEAGRVPLRFEVFLAVHQQYFLNPVWLATGEEQQAFDAPIEDWSRIASLALRNRWLFTEAYDRALEAFCKDRNRMADVLAQRVFDDISRLMDLAKEHRNVRARPDIAFRIKERLKELDVFLESFPGLGLTEAETHAKLPAVKLQLKSLLADLNRVTKEPGMKTKLADFLGAPLASVSRWLSGEREPGGETTLKMLHWVQEQGRQPNAPGSATNIAKGKTQVRKSVYEKQTQVRKKG
jgi:transcriptional regulator with XRE-family HTH domain